MVDVWPGIEAFRRPSGPRQPGLWDESEHPRHPRGTSSGGQFRERADTGMSPVSSGPDRWVQAALHGMGVDLDEGQMLEVVTQGREVARSPLSGGNVGQTAIVTFEMPDGRHVPVVHKRQDGEFSDREVWSSRIGRAIGAPVAAVIHDPQDEDSIYLPLVEGRSALQHVTTINEEDRSLETDYDALEHLMGTHAQTRRAALLGLLDIALLNGDRHGGNWLIDSDGEVWGIDHTHIAPWAEGDYEGYADFGTEVADGLGPLTAVDIAVARRRIGHLVDDDEIPVEWWQPMDDRLQRLEQAYKVAASGYSFPGGAY